MLSPSEDRPTGSIICFGETLWDIFPQDKKAGGAPMNVAYHLARLGFAPVFISRVGNDQLGDELRRELTRLGLSDAHLQTDQAHPTGRVEVTEGPRGECSFRILEDCAWDHITRQEDGDSWMGSKDWLVYGSLAARSAVSGTTLKKLLKRGCRNIFDLNLREPYYTREGILSLMESADLVKMNTRELETLGSWFGISGEEKVVLTTLADRLRCQTILLTRGEEGASLWEKGDYYSQEGFRVRVADTVGCGDAFLAGYLAMDRRGAGPSQKLAFASAMGALIATKAGACPEYGLDMLRDWYPEGW